MRVCLLVVSCTLAMTEPSAAQFDSFDAPFALGSPRAGNIHVPIGSAAGLQYLEKSALLGDRSASALLAVLLQDSPDIEGSLVKSALHFQVAIAAGCSDLDALAHQAVARLSADQRATYDQALPRWIPAGGAGSNAGIKGRCLSW